MSPIDRLNAALAGRYEIERHIGAGGMADVYLARDLRHTRRVALKVLKPDLGAVVGVERFMSEIQVTANLQHPNLLPLFDSGEADGSLFYVMPYVAGESLRARLEREKQLPVEDAVQMATAVASALDYAHRHGVIHRDLKPENILINEGQPLVADFGIALAVSNAAGSRITQTGVSLGTPHYMSPEQATGDRVIDARSDIYSLGAVTYEMLTGEPPHTGNSAQAVIARVLTEQPRSIRIARPSVPPHVEAAVMHALEKLAPDRFSTAREFSEALNGTRLIAVAHAPEARSAHAGASMRRARGSRVTEIVGWALAAVAIITAATVTVLLRRATDRPAQAPVYLSIESLEGRRIVDGFPAVSRDGRRVSFIAESAGVNRLYVHALDQFDARVIPGTEQVFVDSPPFFSPDGEWIAFVANGRLKRVRVDGAQPPEAIAEASDLPTGGSWSADGSIIFAPDIGKGLIRLAAGSGKLENLTTPDRAAGEIGYAFPEVLPNGKAVLFGLVRRDGWSVGVRSLVSERREILIPGATMARYIGGGRLIYVKGGRLYVVPFDEDRLAIDSRVAPVPLGMKVTGAMRAGARFAYYGVSPAGAAVFVSGDHNKSTTIVRFDRAGNGVALREGSGEYPRVSPRGDALLGTDSAQTWLFDLTRNGARTRLTNGAPQYVPVWSPDGSRMVYTSYQDGPANLYMSALSDPGRARRLLAGDFRRYASSWSHDGSWLAYVEVGPPATGIDIWVVPVTGDSVGQPVPVIQTESNDYHPAFSPDGKWLAYASDRTGHAEVYVQAFPQSGGPRRVSPDGGDAPVWNPNGRELVYRRANQLVSVAITPGPVPQFGEPHKLFDARFVRTLSNRAYDISPDGAWFAVETETLLPPRRLDAIVNWRP